MGFGEQVNASGFDPDMVGALPTTPANYKEKVMNEEWRGVIYQGNDYSKYYEVSNFGRFRNARTHKILKQTIGKTGYYGYCGSLGSRQRKKMFKIHKAVAETFIENPNNYEVIN